MQKPIVMRLLVSAALVALTASFASFPSPSPCDLTAMATDASGEYSCGARIEWLKLQEPLDGVVREWESGWLGHSLTDASAHEQVAQEYP